MAEESNSLDLNLWLNREIIPRQNRLKAKFWNILSDVGNEIDLEALLEIHPKSRGLKLSKGNDLLGYPYQVLDLIRDFSPNDGLNIRVLNWFGHGLFLFVLIGKNHSKAPLIELTQQNWQFDLSESPWDYPEIILKGASSNLPTLNEVENSPFYQWHKVIEISSATEIKTKILDELINLNQILSEKMG
ncbi:hypothetical protein SAMN04489724_2818 [Algoriphagus locisalis]|uniref:DUF4268 domain-containing protein n=1 Tax=Algoriphagus locisalis TaxID=305507 RepID=A0A1I7BXG3_9BACT|nr:hypothetical protein [Algoriphagus locisalis]SFT91857.1 hypothetical protein SAMN04489724_2818 [Algoriphagus locisalis]